MVRVKLAGMNVPMKILEDINNVPIKISECIAERITDIIEGIESKKSDKAKLSPLVFQLAELLGEIPKRFTPEVLCAAYARISRKPEDVNKLVEEAYGFVPEARQSNQRIIYGMGHHSVADHALFNFNITGISRLAIEFLEKRRIGTGYTEKSQRYITMGGAYARPQEYDANDLKKFERLVTLQNNLYARSNQRLFEFLKKKNSDKLSKMNEVDQKDFLKLLQGSANEDARFVLGMATEGQLGCSLDGEALELVIREGKYDRLSEIRDMAKQLYNEVVQVAPSLIQLTDPKLFAEHNQGRKLLDDNFEKTPEHIRKLVNDAFVDLEYYVYLGLDEEGFAKEKSAEPKVTFYRDHHSFSSTGFDRKFLSDEQKIVPIRIECNDADTNILAALLHANSKKDVTACYQAAIDLKHQGRAQDFMDQALKYMSPFDKAPRAFENTNGLMFEAAVSASCYAQLKRHRMMMLLSQDYDPSLGYTIPPNVDEAGLGEEFREIIEAGSEFHDELEPKYGKAAEYALTNAHRRRVLINTNMREMTHISRTREDAHAQWEIRKLVKGLSDLVRDYAPIAASVLGGQSELLEKLKPRD